LGEVKLSAIDNSGQAERDYRQVFDTDPLNCAAQMALGFLAREKGDHAAAFTHFDAVRVANLMHAAASLEAATELRELGRLDQAEALYREISTAAPTAAVIGLGQVARQRGNRAEALQEFERALAACPDHAGARLEVAAEYRYGGRREKAQALCCAVLETEPNNFWALMALGHLARDCGDHTAALSWFEAASRADPRHLEVRQDLAIAALDADRLDEAESAFQTILDQNPRNMRARMGLGYVARKRGDHGAAFSHFKIGRASCRERVLRNV
jgi:tetratricopeptide (TPR) repeat protein